MLTRSNKFFENTLEKIARIMASNFGVRVVIEGNLAYTDGEKIVLPMLEDVGEELRSDLDGFLDHEVAHVKFTDFKAITSKTIKNRYHKELFNGIEDSRIELLLPKEFPGTQINLERLNAKWGAKMDEVRPNMPWPIRLMTCIREIYDRRPVKSDPQIEPILAVIYPQCEALRDCKTSKEVITETRKLIDLINKTREELFSGLPPMTEEEIEEALEKMPRGGETSIELDPDRKKRKGQKAQGDESYDPAAEWGDDDDESDSEFDSDGEGSDGDSDEENEQGGSDGSDGKESDNDSKESKGKNKGKSKKSNKASVSAEQDGDEEGEGDSSSNHKGEEDKDSDSSGEGDESDEESDKDSDEGTDGDSASDKKDKTEEESKGKGKGSESDEDEDEDADSDSSDSDGDSEDNETEDGESYNDNDPRNKRLETHEAVTEKEKTEKEQLKKDSASDTTNSDSENDDINSQKHPRMEWKDTPEEAQMLKDGVDDESAFDDHIFSAESYMKTQLEEAVAKEPEVNQSSGYYSRHEKVINAKHVSLPFSREYDEVIDYSGRGDQDKYAARKLLVMKHVRPITERLERVLKIKENAKLTFERERGQLNTRTLAQLCINKNYRTPFKQFTKIDTSDVAVTLLMDCSGSMSGNKIEVARQTGVALAEALKNLDMSFEVLGFNTSSNQELASKVYNLSPTEIGRFNRFGETLRLMVFKSFATTNLSGICLAESGGANADGESIVWAAKRLAQREEKRKIMIVLSDGQPSYGSCNHTVLAGDLKRVVAMLPKSGIEVIGVGIQTDDPKLFYPNWVMVDDLSKLSTTVIGKLSELLRKGIK